MEIFTVISGKLNNNTYILTHKDKAILIDAAAESKDILPYVKDKKVVGIFLTHGHYDHFENINDLLKTFGCKCYLHPKAFDKFGDKNLNASIIMTPLEIEVSKDNCVFVKDGEKINVFDKEITVIELPGHTDCGLGFVVDEKLFCGDTLFNGGYGRTDLLTSSSSDMRNSLRRLTTEFKGIEFFSGHGTSGFVK